MIVACASFLLFAIPHTIYHFFNLGPYTTGDAIANAIALAATVVLPLWVLFELRRPASARAAGAAPRAGRRRQRPDRRRAGGHPQPARAGRATANRGGATATVIDPLRIYAHHPKVMVGYSALELGIRALARSSTSGSSTWPSCGRR